MRRRPGFGRDLQQIAAALVGTAAATQVIPAKPPVHINCAHDPDRTGGLGDSMICSPIPPAADLERLDVHAALNTYESPEAAEPGVTFDEAARSADVVGENGRWLLIRDLPDGTWIGGCKISNPDDLRMIAAWLALQAGRRMPDAMRTER